MPKVMKKNKVEDFNKLRKRRQRAQILKRLLILAVFAGGVAGVFFLNSLLVETSVTTRISDFFSGLGGTGYPVPVPGGVIRDVKSVGDHLAVLNDTNLYIYSPKARQVFNAQSMSDNTVLLAGSDRLLTFDAGNKRFSVHSRTKTLLQKELEFGIIAAGMNDGGEFALVSSAKQAICEVNVYNRGLAEIYRCSFAQNLVNTVSISPKGNAMAAGWLSGDGTGTLLSGVNLYRFSNDSGPVATLELPDQLILDISYQEEERIAVLTDREYLILGTDGKVKSRYSLNGRQVVAVETEGRLTLLLCENKESRTRDLVLLNGDCEEKAVLAMGEKIQDIALSTRRAYVLTEEGIQTYNHQMELQAVEPARFVGGIQLTGGRLYYLDREEIMVLGMNREESSVDGELVASSKEAA